MSFRNARHASPGPSQARSPGSSRARSPGPSQSRSPGPRSISPGPARAVVIDTGTGTCKAGFAGEQTPQSVIGTLVGHPTVNSIRTVRNRPDTFVGERARLEPDLDVVFPVRHGIITDWEVAEELWRHLFYHDLKVAPEDHALLMSDPPLCPTTNREKLVEVVFESLNSPSMYVAYQSVLSIYAHGKISGLVVDTGHAITHTVPVYHGYNLPHATERMDIAGANMTSFLMDLLKDMGHYFDERMVDMVNDIKEKCCYVARDFQTEWHRPKREYLVEYQLPDGQIISLGKERFQCPEMLFNPPQMPGLTPIGIHSMAHRSLKKVPEDSRKEVCENIVLCGGSSLFEGLEKRFTHELMAAMQPNAKVKVTANPLSKYSVWTGGSILASLRNFQPCWIRKEQYEEHGPYIVHQKCY